MTAHFLTPAEPGHLQIRNEVVRDGVRHTTAASTLVQHGRELARVLTTLGSLNATGHVRSWDAGPPALPPPDECIHAEPVDGLAFEPPPITRRVELRLHPEQVGFTLGLASDRPVVSGWARLADGRPPDTRALPLFADAFPPALFNAGPPLAWVPTMELSVQIRARPAPGWLRCVFRTRFLTAGYVEEDGEIWDSDDKLVALSRQLALAPREGG